MTDFDESRIDSASYRLRVGDEIYVTPNSEDLEPKYRTKQRLTTRECVAIPSGQFAILITEERVTVPDDAMALIALRSKYPKFRGLVNVSGFHADPGYDGRLLFAVFNAGPNEVHVSRGDPWFMISFIGLDRRSKKVRTEPGYECIPAEFISALSGQFRTFKGLDEKIDETREELVERLHVIEREHTITRWAAVFVLGALLMVGVRFCAPASQAATPADMGAMTKRSCTVGAPR